MAHHEPNAARSRKKRRRFNVGAALTLMTCLLIAVGVVVVRRLAGDSPPPTLRLGSPPAAPKEPVEPPTEALPHVLRPHDAAVDSPLSGAAAAGRGPVIGAPMIRDELRPAPLRTAKQGQPARYR